MKKIIKFFRNKITCEIWLIIILVLVILGSVLPFQKIGSNKEFIYIESKFKAVCIVSIVLLMASLILALLKQTKILKWFLFLVAFFVVISLFLLFVESMRNHYSEGKTKYAIGTYLYSVGAIIMMLLGMYSLAGTLNTFKK